MLFPGFVYVYFLGLWMLYPGPVNVITWVCVSYYMGPCVLLPGSMYMLLPGFVNVISWACVCYFLVLCMLFPGSVHVITLVCVY